MSSSCFPPVSNVYFLLSRHGAVLSPVTEESVDVKGIKTARFNCSVTVLCLSGESCSEEDDALICCVFNASLFLPQEPFLSANPPFDSFIVF